MPSAGAQPDGREDRVLEMAPTEVRETARRRSRRQRLRSRFRRSARYAASVASIYIVGYVRPVASGGLFAWAVAIALAIARGRWRDARAR